MKKWDSISLLMIRKKFTELLSHKILSVQPMGIYERDETKEVRQYPNKYDTFIDIQSLEWYLLDEIERLNIKVSTLGIGKRISWEQNTKDKEYEYIDNIGKLTITGWSKDLNGGQDVEYVFDKVINDSELNKLEIDLNPQQWNYEELNNLIERIKGTTDDK